MFYLDTSVWVASLVEEPKSPAVRAWLAGSDPEELAISDWVVTEFSSALSLKLRTNQIGQDERASALRAFNLVINASLYVLPIVVANFRSAARFADNHLSGLRAGDALHLAMAAEYSATVCTLDTTLAAAGSTFGIETVLI